mmetsp:Transcript_6453/g.12141  ORF Transcript_6453/g.12141 Transcript_6453/m.12141 type:complete len:329 (+) Transcript_6453:174-1160(+)
MHSLTFGRFEGSMMNICASRLANSALFFLFAFATWRRTSFSNDLIGVLRSGRGTRSSTFDRGSTFVSRKTPSLPKCFSRKAALLTSFLGKLPHSSIWRSSIWLSFVPLYRIFPVRSSHSVAPADQMSQGKSRLMPARISGALYPMLPISDVTGTPLLVLTTSCRCRDEPKSDSLTVLRSIPISRLSGFRSAWISPQRLHRERALRSWKPMERTSVISSGLPPRLLMYSLRFMSIGSNTMHRWPLCSKCENKRTQFLLPSGSLLVSSTSFCISSSDFFFMYSLLRITLITHSLSPSAWSLTRSTVLKVPRPCLEVAKNRPLSTSPGRKM